MNILIVDDKDENRYLLEALLQGHGHTLISASNGAEALEKLMSFKADLIISDILMPVMDGFQFCRIIKSDHQFKHIPFIFYTATYTGPQDEELAVKIGAAGFIIKPCEPEILMAKVNEVMAETSKRPVSAVTAHPAEEEILKLYNERLVRKLEQKMMQAEEELLARRAAEEALRERTAELKEALIGSISAMSGIVEKRDPYTAGHQIRVAKLAKAIAFSLGISEDVTEGIFQAGVIHDIGKISIPAEILSKPGMLSVQEFSLIKEHPQTGYDILRPIKFPWPIAQIALQHHERMNGSGYPNMLSGDDILPEARILAVADVVEAMSSHRPYRPALGIDMALNEINKNKGILYDAEVADACQDLFQSRRFTF